MSFICIREYATISLVKNKNKLYFLLLSCHNLQLSFEILLLHNIRLKENPHRALKENKIKQKTETQRKWYCHKVHLQYKLLTCLSPLCIYDVFSFSVHLPFCWADTHLVCNSSHLLAVYTWHLFWSVHALYLTSHKRFSTTPVTWQFSKY